MASHDVAQFLASLGSPLVESSGDAVQKKLPAVAVVQLLDAKIETLATKTQAPPTPEAMDGSATAEDLVTDEIHEALKAYSKATARYTHTSMVASAIVDVTRALRHVVALQQAMESDTESIGKLCANAERELAKIGIQADFQQAMVTLDAEAPLASYASMDLLLSRCKSIANQFSKAQSEEYSFGLDVESTKGSIRWTTELADHAGRPKHVLDTEMQINQLVQQLLEQVVEPLLNSASQWKATPTENGLLLEKTAGAASLKAGAGVPELKAVLTTLQPLIPENLNLRASLLRRCIPQIIDLAKTHLSSCLPALYSSSEVQESKALLPTAEKPSAIVAEKPPPVKVVPQAPVVSPKTPLTKGKKPTLGVVKIGAKFPSTNAPPETVTPKNEEPEDDWDWGDEEEEDAAPQDTSNTATEKEDLDDDWGWGDDDAEVEQILSETTEPPSIQRPQETGPASMENDSFDAWDWNENEDEQEPEMPTWSETNTTTFSSPPTDQPSHLWQSYSVSKRIIEIHDSLATQWLRMDEDVKMRPWTAQGLVESVQLYRALMPHIHGQVLQNVPLLGMLFVNDCAFTAIALREFATQSHKWGAFRLTSRQTLEASLRAEADLLDDMSKQWRTSLLAFQAHSLHECMDQADGFSRTDVNARYEACERAILQVQHLLSHLVAVWRPVMAAETLAQIMCELVDGLFSRVMQEIEDLQDISEPESMRLAKLCHMLLEAATSVLEGAETQVPTYFKFAYLPDILQGSMADLEYLLFGNESGSALCDYTREEMVMLVRALFADTPNRRRLLDGIQRWNGGSHV
ncbi:ribosome biogenesis protein ytm1 [Malassezia caprae]|uniref:Ribosome biogenesis protein ytm1 n=1 Tax=Malassezia caprae TaxID=1381934 RepID=A0AAF0E7P0_9BASI|nr:ribosome biogenesis protein ytm1 [Malassezia caprae]